MADSISWKILSWIPSAFFLKTLSDLSIKVVEKIGKVTTVINGIKVDLVLF